MAVPIATRDAADRLERDLGPRGFGYAAFGDRSLHDALLESIQPGKDIDVEAAWRQEVAVRLGAGEVETVPWEEVRDRLFVRLRERQAS